MFLNKQSIHEPGSFVYTFATITGKEHLITSHNDYEFIVFLKCPIDPFSSNGIKKVVFPYVASLFWTRELFKNAPALQVHFLAYFVMTK